MRARSLCAQPAHLSTVRLAKLVLPWRARSLCAQLANLSTVRLAKLVLPWHARSLHAACAQHARSMPAAWFQVFSNVDRIFQTLSNPIFIEISSHNKLPIIKSMIFRTFSNLQNDI
jgi:hypothetical protein